MTYLDFLKRTLTIFVLLALFAGFWYLRSIFMITFLAAIIAVSLSVPVNKLQKHLNMKRGPAIGITLVVTASGLVLLIMWIFPVFIVQMTDLVSDTPKAFDLAVETYGEWRIKQPKVLQAAFPEFKEEEITRFLGIAGEDNALAFNVEEITSFALPVLRGAGNVIVGVIANFAIVIIVSIFLLVDPMDYARGIITLVPPAYHQRVFEIMVKVQSTVTMWMSAQILSITVTVFLVWLILGMILGVPNSLALGVIAGLMTFIPNIGSVVPLVPITIFTLADEPNKLPFVLLAYLAIQQLESSVLTPSIVKRQLHIPAGALLIFQLISGALFGFFGILLAVPLLAVLITLVRELYVYDVLGMRDKEITLKESPDGQLVLVTDNPSLDS